MPRSHRTVTAALLLATALTLTACTNEFAPPAPTNSAEAHGNDEHELIPNPTSTPDAVAAKDAAVATLTAFGNRDQAYADWFAALTPHLHASVVDEYATVNPARIPEFEITGNAIIDELTTSDRYAVITIPTSIGDYVLELRRDTTTDPWGATRIQPPV